ncbi:MAG: AbrB/MazE/SpoVT family DNA-binding domain-containing protein [Longimicrobiales bacterium]
MITSKLSTTGQLPIPPEVQAHLGVRAGDPVEFVLQPGGGVVLRRELLHVRQLRGMLADDRPGRTVSVEEMKEAVASDLLRQALEMSAPTSPPPFPTFRLPAGTSPLTPEMVAAALTGR